MTFHRKTLNDDTKGMKPMDSKKFQHGFTVIRAQPFHIGHNRLIQELLNACEYVSIVIGSANEVGTFNNPFPYHVRKKMIQNVYRGTPDYNRLWILPVNDTVRILEWPQDVMNAIHQENPNLPTPDVYAAGVSAEFQWFEGFVRNFILCDRTSQDFPFLSGSVILEMIQYGDTRWKDLVHPQNIELIEKTLSSTRRL